MMNELEKRLANTETALIALWAIMKDTMPPDHQDVIDEMMSDFFGANSSLGSNFNDGTGFEHA